MINELAFKMENEEPQNNVEWSRSRPPSPVMVEDERKRKPGLFFNKICSFILEKKFQQPQKSEVAFILVTHIVSTLPYLLQAIESIGEIALIIPKSSYRNRKIYEYIKSAYKMQLFSKDNPKLNSFIQKQYPNNEEVTNYRSVIENHAITIIQNILKNNNQEFLIIDIGGYFARCLEKICEKYGKRILGVVEDTENGHQKYEEFLSCDGQNLITCPIISIARSDAKEIEDYHVGKAIVKSTERLITETGGLIERLKVGVIGFGKIGKSIAEHLNKKGIKALIFDKDVSKLIKASSFNFTIATRETLLTSCDLIFCATGNQSLIEADFFHLKDNVFIASCTSADDEFDLTLLKKEGILYKMNNNQIDKYYINNETKRINLLHGGNAINFIDGAVHGPYIYSVLASLLVCGANLITKKHQQLEAIQSIPKKDEKEIFHLWLEIFETEHHHHEENLRINNSQLLHRLFSPLNRTCNKARVYISFVDDFLESRECDKAKLLIKFLYQSALNFGSTDRHIRKIKKNDIFKRLFNTNEITPFKDDQENHAACLEVIKHYADTTYLQYFVFHLCNNELKENTPDDYVLILYWIKLYYAQGVKNAELSEANTFYLLLLVLMPSKDRDELIQNKVYREIIKNIILNVLNDIEIDPVIKEGMTDLGKIVNQEFNENEYFSSISQYKKYGDFHA